MKRKKVIQLLLVSMLSTGLIFGGCASENAGVSGSSVEITQSLEEKTQTASGTNKENQEQSAGSQETSIVQVSTMDVSDMFSNRDKEVGYDESTSVVLNLNQNSIECADATVMVADQVATITKAGTYILRGSLDNGRIVIDVAEEEKVQLVLENVSLSCKSSAPIYVKQADKVFITLAPDSNNTVINTGSFIDVDENNIDSAIFATCDLTLNGTGSLTVSSESGHGIYTKKDLVVTSGSYTVESGRHAFSGKNSVRIANGTFRITSGKDGFHSGNDTDADKGYIYIADGDIQIAAQDDGIQAETKLIIAGGNIQITESDEGLSACSIEMTDGTVQIVASDDGISASNGESEGFGFGKMGFGGTEGSSTEGVEVLISGGTLTIQADGDGIDSNGGLTITGGAVFVYGPEKAGNGTLDYTTHGTITGGTFFGAGDSGMAMNFDTDSTQGSILVNVGNQKAGTLVSLMDEAGNTLLQCQPTVGFSSVVISNSQLQVGNTYKVVCGDSETNVTMNSLIEGTGFSMGGGFGGNRGNRENFQGFTGDENFQGFDGNMTPPNGNFQGSTGDENFQGFDGNMTPPNGNFQGFTGDENFQGFDGNMTPPDGNFQKPDKDKTNRNKNGTSSQDTTI